MFALLPRGYLSLGLVALTGNSFALSDSQRLSTVLAGLTALVELNLEGTQPFTDSS